MMLILPIHEHGICFHLFVSFFVSFFSVLQFCEYRSFTSLVKFIPKYFIFLVAIVNGISPLISVSDISLQCTKMPLISGCLLCIPLFCQIHFQVEQFFSWCRQDFLFFMYTIMLSANSDSFTSSFPIWMPFISHSRMITVARISNTTLSRSGEPQLVQLSGFMPTCEPKGCQFNSWSRADAWVVGWVPSEGCARGNHTLMSLSLSFSLPSPL